MMKVAPRPSTSGIIAAWLMRTKLPKVRKFGLMAAMIAQSRTSTMSGAQARAASAQLPPGAVRGCVSVVGMRQGRHPSDAVPQTSPSRDPARRPPDAEGAARSSAPAPLRLSCTGSAR